MDERYQPRPAPSTSLGGAHRVSDALLGSERMFEEQAFVPPRALDPPAADPLARLDGCVTAMSAASAETLDAVATCDTARLWRRDGATPLTCWLAARYGLTRATACEWVRVARARRLPAIARAYGAGRLSFDQLRPLTRFARPEEDEEWARRAPRGAPGACGGRPGAGSASACGRLRRSSGCAPFPSPGTRSSGCCGCRACSPPSRERRFAKRSNGGPRRSCWPTGRTTLGERGWPTPWCSVREPPEAPVPKPPGHARGARRRGGPDGGGAPARTVAGGDRERGASDDRGGPPDRL